jgi:hypothetical protein
LSGTSLQPAGRVFEKQGYHLLAAVISVVVLHQLAGLSTFSSGEWLGRSSRNWFWLAAAVPILHQAFVALVWRTQLAAHTPTRLLGNRAFPAYGAVFMVLFLLRPVTLIGLALSNQGSLGANSTVLAILSVLVAVPSGYVLYSVGRYFGLERALGADHFESAYREIPFEKRGAFKHMDNAMYAVGLMALYLPGLIWNSSAALLLGAFNHAYIWVHFYTTERPDMRVIYGDDRRASDWDQTGRQADG